MPSNNAIVRAPGAPSPMPKSIFKGSVPGFASMNYGRIYPVFMKYQEAHSKFSLDPSTLIRGATPITTTMGNSVMELHAFSVPWRIVWNYTKQFFGENDVSMWTQTNNYTKPQIKLRVGSLDIMPTDSTVALSATGTKNTTVAAQKLALSYDYVKIGDLGLLTSEEKTKYGLGADIEYSLYVDVLTSDCYGPNKLADYMGIHPIPKNAKKSVLLAYFDTYIANGYKMILSVDALPFRAFFSVVNYYYRDENYQAPYLFSKDNTDLLLGISSNESGRLPMPYDFMEYRPIGQYNRTASLTGNFFEGSAFCPPASRLKDPFSTIVPEPLKGDQYDLLTIAGLAPVSGFGSDIHVGDSVKFGGPGTAVDGGLKLFGTGNNNVYVDSGISTSGSGSVAAITGTNLYADLAAASKITLEKFRDWVKLNQWNEKAVKGTRFAEVLQEFYGVPVNPALLDEPRFLGGVKIPISSWQVPQTAPNTDGSGVGDLGAFTHTKDQSNLFVFSFDEPSILLVCAVSRVEHTFAQQVDPHWFRKDKFDEHYPLFDGLGYQPMDKRIPYLPYGVIKDNGGSFPESSSDVLGFQEYAWEERFTLGNSAGVLNASNPYSLDYFLYNELPSENPVGGPEYLSAYRDAEIVDRTLQLGEQASLLAQQLLVNFSWNYIEAKMISKSGRNPGLDRI